MKELSWLWSEGTALSRPAQLNNGHWQEEGDEPGQAAAEVGPQMLKRMRERIRTMHRRRWMFWPWEEIAPLLNPILRGWIQDDGRLYSIELRATLFGYRNEHRSAGLCQKYSRLLRHDHRSGQVLARIAQVSRDLFASLARCWCCGWMPGAG